MRLDMHLHTLYSPDSSNRLKDIERELVRKGIDGCAITDHNTIRGAQAAKKAFKDRFLIPGLERKTDVGDLIGLFVNEPVKAFGVEEVIDEYRRQDAIIILPHPFDTLRAHSRRDFVEKVDGIEALNARASQCCNKRAEKLAEEKGKAKIGGSDSHFLFEVGRAWTEFKGATEEEIRKEIRKAATSAGGKLTSFWWRAPTSALKLYKKMGGKPKGNAAG